MPTGWSRLHELKPITHSTDALSGGSPLIHTDRNIMSRAILKRGNAAEAIKNSKYESRCIIGN